MLAMRFASRSNFGSFVAKKKNSLPHYVPFLVVASDASAAAVCSVDDDRGDSP